LINTNMIPKTQTHIRPSSKVDYFDLKELWRYRELLYLLAARDVRLRYKQTAFGVVWAVLQPLLPAAIFAVIFGVFAKLPSNGSPYLLFVFTGTMIWNLFSQAISRAGNSLVGNSSLISKVYFPRMIVPLSSIGAVVFDFAVTSVLLVVLMCLYKTSPSLNLVFFPFFLLLALVTAVGMSLWLSALNVKYRDFMYAMPFFIQVWLYATPVVYASSLIPQKFRWLYSINPAVGFVEGFRWSVLGSGTLSASMILVSSAVAVLSFVTGLVYFKSTERKFADVI
jgi:lipopolysaccharide transport system permease protein